MHPLREELQSYSSICETLLGSALEPELTQEEQNLILYYAIELFQKFDHHRSDQVVFARA
jgi:hypothetical protein